VGLSKHEALIIRSIRVFDSTGTTRMVISEAFHLKERVRFQQYFSYIEAVSFIGLGNRSTQKKPPTCRKSLTNFIAYCCIEYTSPSARLELTTLVVICSDCTGRCKSNYHTITTMMPATSLNDTLIITSDL
jgi:hypothetical protein